MRFILSCELYWGYGLDVDDLYYDYDSTTIQQVIDLIKKDLKAFMMSKGLEVLVNKVDGLELHSHEFLKTTTLQQIVNHNASPNMIVYLCDCC